MPLKPLGSGGYQIMTENPSGRKKLKNKSIFVDDVRKKLLEEKQKKIATYKNKYPEYVDPYVDLPSQRYLKVVRDPSTLSSKMVNRPPPSRSPPPLPRRTPPSSRPPPPPTDSSVSETRKRRGFFNKSLRQSKKRKKTRSRRKRVGRTRKSKRRAAFSRK